MDYSPWFEFWESRKSLEIMIPLERASQREQNGANFSFLTPSSEDCVYYSLRTVTKLAVSACDVHGYYANVHV